MPNNPAWFAQTSARVRLEWGRRGARAAAERLDLLVVVDALSFSTAVSVAVSRGAAVYPCARGEDTLERATAIGAEVAVHRDRTPTDGRFSLSPVSMQHAESGTRILIASPNGATCARYGATVPALYAGAFVNASAVATAVTEQLAQSPDRAVTVLACGERWDIPDPDDGDLRFALEDYLAAGAILVGLPPALSRSPEAEAAIAAFTAIADDLPRTLRACGSGIELISKGYASDVEVAAHLNSLTVVPLLRDGAFVAG